jgi:hypothetical protein
MEIDSLKLLQYLKDNKGLHNKISISPLVDELFPTPLDFSESQYKIRPLYRLIGTLETEGLIKNIELPSPNGSTYTWDIKKNIQMELTTSGDKYLTDSLQKETQFEVSKLALDDHELTQMVHKSVIDTNRKTIDILNEQAQSNDTIAINSTRQANFSKYQTWIALGTGIFILGSLAVALFTILRDNRIDTLNLELRHKDSTIHIARKDIIRLQSDTAHLEQVVRGLQKK